MTFETVNDPAKPEKVHVVETGAGLFQVEAQASGSRFLVDEPTALGGLGSGPNPYDLLGAALASCTAMTLRLYARRKNLPLERISVSVSHTRGTLTSRDRFEREIQLDGALDEDQHAKLLAIANRCPVHATLTAGADIVTELSKAPNAEVSGQSHGLHMQHMIESCDDPTRAFGG